MRKEKFSKLLKRQEELEREILLAFLELSAKYVTENYVQGQHVTDYVVENHDLQYHVITENLMKDHSKG